MPLIEGNKAPDFALPTDLDRVFKLSDHRGRWLILYFYPKDDTSGCTMQAIDFSTMKDRFAELNVKILGVSCDTVEKHKKFKEKHQLTIELAADCDKIVVNEYGVWVQKSMYGKTYFGIERSTFLINPDGDIVKIWRKVKVKEHAETILSYLGTVL